MTLRTGLFPSLDLRGSGARAQACAIAGFLVAALVLGGASAAGVTANAVLQVAAVVALTAVAWRRWPTPLLTGERQLLILLGLFAVLFALQLVPLPPAVWTALPGRGPVAGGLAILGIAPRWMPLSLAPAQTLHAAVALLPPAAMIVMGVRFRRAATRATLLALLGAMLISLILGVAQFSGGGVYLYANTNGGSATGFFANANHFATLMCVAMPLAAGLAAHWRGGAAERGASRALAIAVLLAVVLLGLLGIAMTKSIAGMLLALLAILGSVAITLAGLSRRLQLGLLGGVVLVIVVAGLVVFSGMAGDFAIGSVEGGDMSRPMMWGITRHAIAAFWVAGSGFGSFQQVFHLFEDPAQVSNVFANHAHNDLLEFVLEGGIPGALLLLAFLGWFGRRVAHLWLVERRRDPLAQGASVAATIILLHSLADYPLRTAALATVFGLCLALMARAAGGAPNADVPAQTNPGRHLSA